MSRWLRSGVGVTMLPLAALAACSGDGTPTSLPSDSGPAPSGSAPSTATVTGASRDQVLAAYRRALEPYRLFWLEDPVPAEVQESFRLIRQHTTTPGRPA